MTDVISEVMEKGILLLETIAVLCCIHGMFPKVKLADMRSGVFILGNVILLEVINTYSLGHIRTTWLYLGWCMFFLWKFRCSLKRAVWGTVICVVMVTVLQFLVAVILVLCGVREPLWISLAGNGLVIIVLLWFRRKSQICNLMLFADKGVIGWIVLLGTVLVMSADLLVYSKLNKGVWLENFLGAIPIAGLLLLIMGSFFEKNKENSQIKEELQQRRDLQYLYQDLLNQVRIKQHNFNNQITAILGSHYIYKTYEELVKSQEELCENIQQDNKFYKLLWLQDGIVAGYLYQKFKELEKEGVKVEYTIATRNFRVAVPIQVVMEILGILLDNAAEATKGMSGETESDKRDSGNVEAEEGHAIIWVSIAETEDCNILEFSNVHPMVSYEEIESWFAFGQSGKGKNRGIGLARVRQLCEDYPCDIGVENRKTEGENRIVFSLFLEKDFETKRGP